MYKVKGFKVLNNDEYIKVVETFVNSLPENSSYKITWLSHENWLHAIVEWREQ